MPMNIHQFLPTFIEETQEMLQQMEKALLEIEIAHPDPEKLNLIFRVMHSVKSGSAAFGLNSISEFAHGLENLLQKIRDGKHQINNTDINLFFSTIDYLRTAIESIKNNQPIDEAAARKIIQSAMEASLLDEEKVVEEGLVKKPPMLDEKSSKPIPSRESVEKDQAQKNEKELSWHIHFIPEFDLFRKGNDPFRVFHHLKKTGNFSAQAQASRLVDLEEIEPDACYLSWNIELNATKATCEEIEDTFSWITTPSTLQIELNQNPFEKKPDQKVNSDIPPPDQKEIPSADLNLVKEASFPRTTIRVATEKIDRLMNTIGDLVITKSMLNQTVEHLDLKQVTELREGLAQLERNVRELQEGIMCIRMVSVSFAFERIPRLVHTMAEQMKKQIELLITGEETELDKIVMEKVTDPIVHLVRNAVDHGIELPHVREKMGKSPIGKITLKAYQEGSSIIIEVQDDGAGLNKTKIRLIAIEKGLISESEDITNEQVYQLIFHPGFSTAEKVSEVSGRGVGLDVVYRNVTEVGGNLDIQSTPGKGSTFRLRIPLTLAIMDCQLIRVAEQNYLVPLTNIIELLKIEPEKINQLDADTKFYKLREGYVPMIYLREALNTGSDKSSNKEFLIVVNFSNQLYGLVCDGLLAQHQVVIKNVEENYHKVPGISGASILGDGKLAFIIDMGGMIALTLQPNQVSHLVGTEVDTSTPLKTQTALNPDQKMQCLSFVISNQEYAVDILDVLGIETMGNVTPIPNAPVYIKGMVSLHGIIAPVINLRARFTLDNSDYTSNAPIIMLRIGSGRKKKTIGILVDAVSNEFTLLQKEIKPLPESSQSPLVPHVLGVATVMNKMIAVLKIDHFIQFEEFPA